MIACRAVAVLWAVVNELLIQPREYTAFNLSLQKLRDDPRIMVMIGTPVSGYGQETHSRAARQRIPHKVYSDENGREHVQVIALLFVAQQPNCTSCSEREDFSTDGNLQRCQI